MRRPLEIGDGCARMPRRVRADGRFRVIRQGLALKSFFGSSAPRPRADQISRDRTMDRPSRPPRGAFREPSFAVLYPVR